MKNKLHSIRIGTSGWSYKHWRGTFYPDGLPVSRQFEYYQEHFDTVELNSPFYRLPTRETFAKWRESVGPEFLFSVKANRFITHMKKLSDPAQSLLRTIHTASALEENLGPILFQLPPKWKLNLERFSAFVEKLPKQFRFAFEFREHSWYDPRVYKLMEEYNCAFCIYDLGGHQSPLEITADFVYIRLHGPEGKYAGSYSDKALEDWAARILEWRERRDVFVYFDNDIGTAAPRDAQRLLALTRR